MYKVFLSQSQLKEYLKVLIENELLRYDSVTRTFKTTQKGLKFLQLYNKINEVLLEKEEQQEDAERKIGPLNMRQTGY
jgi:predicted transcriptional regulator